MNEEHSDSIRKAFEETYFGEPHKELTTFLQENNKPVAPEPVKARPLVCPHGCTEAFRDKKAFNSHIANTCWNRRPTVLHPVSRRTVRNLNAEWVPGLVGQVLPFADSKLRGRVFLGDHGHFHLESRAQIHTRGQKENLWWWSVRNAVWRAATAEELAIAKKLYWLT